MRVESVDSWKQEEPPCCVAVECVPRVVGGRTIEGWAEGLCPRRCHRVVEGEFRQVFDLRTGSAQAVWSGVKR